jgi:hypothetical protein
MNQLTGKAILKRTSDIRPLLFWGFLIMLFGVGLLVRIFCSMGELWFDELWSLNMIFPLKTPLQIFTELHHENNHHLISLWIWICGDGKEPWLYRLPSILAGMGAMVIAVRIAIRQSQATAVIAGFFFSLSYLSIFYSSEARGYAIACFMALVAYDALELFLQQRRWHHGVIYGLAIITGILGNLTYVSIALACGAWSCAVLLWKERCKKSILQFALLHTLPVTASCILWLVDIRWLINGGGPKVGIWSILCGTFSYILGLPGDFFLGGVIVTAATLLTGWQIIRMCMAGDLRWVFFATTLYIAPTILFAATGRVHVYPRYFLPNVFCLYLLAALAAGSLWAMTSTGSRRLLLLSLAAWVVGNSVLFCNLIKTGRGHYREALEFIAANSSTTRPFIGSTNDVRSKLLFGYYSRHLPEAKRPVLVTTKELAKIKPEWILATISPYEQTVPQREIQIVQGAKYQLIKQFSSVNLSGFEANVYRNTNRQ